MHEQQFPRSPYDELHGMVYFPRLLDKIRLHAAGKLGEAYIPNLGRSEKFDGMCLRFLGVDYEALKKVILAGASDEAAWEWCLKNGKTHTAEEITIWNRYMMTSGWHDSVSEILQRRLKESGYEERSDIQTFFDYIDLDEGRASHSNIASQ